MRDITIRQFFRATKGRLVQRFRGPDRLRLWVASRRVAMYTLLRRAAPACAQPTYQHAV